MDPSEYSPEPENTAAIELDPNLCDKIEALARNNHEVWARARIDEGWKYGPERNDARKEHPGLVPYEQLSEAEKEIDRGTVVQALKAAVKLGLEIQPTTKAKGSDCREAHQLSVDDMDEWPSWPKGLGCGTTAELNKALKAIGCTYQAANKSAGVNLLLHRIVALSVAIGGTYAVVMAILQLYRPDETPAVAWAELVCAGVAAVAVFVGLAFAFMRKWLVRRHRAERCRFLKFNFLLEVALAGQDHARLQSSARIFEEQAYNLALLEFDQMELWLEEEQVLRNPPVAPQNETAASDLRILAENYLRTRLAVQSRYFYKQSGRNTRWNLQSQNLAPMLFAGSICFALIHFLIGKRWHQYAENTRYLVLLAAVLPVLGAGIRAVRGIWEYSRNTLRFTAKYNALRELMTDLETELRAQTSCNAIVRLLWKGEQILEGEHREWLRLMMETEWIS
jgi:hypothetical protein